MAVIALLLVTNFAAAQEVLKTFPVSQRYANLSGTPRIVRNENQRSWLVAWRQQNRILGRLMRQDGSAGAQHTLASGVSSSPNSFDITYDPVRDRYALIYQNHQGLQFVVFTSELKTVGLKHPISGSDVGTAPRLVFDPSSQKFLSLWLDAAGNGQNGIESVVVDSDGSINSVQHLARSGTNSGFADLQIGFNPGRGNVVAIARLVERGAHVERAALVAYVLNASGLLSRNVPLTLQPSSPGLHSSGNSAFAPDGSGFAVWSYGTSLKYRKLSAAGGINSSVKNIVNATDSDSANPSMVFDPLGKQFIAVWTAGGKLVSTIWNTTGSITVPQFEVLQSPGGRAQNPDASLDPQQGNLLSIWEDVSKAAPNTFQVRAALFFPGRSAAEQSVTIGDNFFTPKNLTVDVGAIVTWTNNGFNAHTVTSGTPVSQIGMLFDSGTIGHGNKYSFRFTKTGSIPYFCRVHGAIQSGTINVK